MSLYDIRVLFTLFMFYSIAGWCMEVIRQAIFFKKAINRGFFIGPYCPIYGVGAVLMTLLLQRYINNPILLFLMCIILFSSLEYFTSYIMEKLFNARWWDYSDRKYNLNGRICIGTTIPFGIFGLISIYIINPFIIDVIEALPPTLMTFIVSFVFVLFLIDVILSFRVISNLKMTANSVRKDNTEEITKAVREILLGKNYPKRRLVNAFPKINIK